MFRTAVTVRVLAVLAVGALTLGAVALRPQPAAAQIPEFNTNSEYLVTNTTVTRTQPSLSAPIFTTLFPNTLVYVVNRFSTSDGILWYQLRFHNLAAAGFAPATALGLQFAGTNTFVGGYPQFVTGVSPFVVVNPFINPFSLIPRQIVPRQQPVFVPSVGFFQ